MSVSIVMSVFNKALFLKKTINSVLSQSHEDFEFIIIDGGSTDNSLKILNTVKDKRIKLFSQYNVGIAGARNFGIRVSNYEFVTFIDADDEWDSNFLKEMIMLKNSYPSCKSFVSGYTRKFPNYEDEVVVRSDYQTGIIKDYFSQRMLGWGVHTSSVAIYKKEILSVGGFPVLIASKTENKSYVLNIYGDIIFECEPKLVLEKGKWVYDKEKIVCKSNKIKNIDSYKVSVPGIPGEDQYLWDMLFINYKYAFTKTKLSYWNGDVPSQASTNPLALPIFPHLISLSSNIIKSNSSILKYLNYLDQNLIFRFKGLENEDFKNILVLHSFFKRNIFIKSYFNNNIIKLLAVTNNYFFRFKNKIKSLLK